MKRLIRSRKRFIEPSCIVLRSLRDIPFTFPSIGFAFSLKDSPKGTEAIKIPCINVARTALAS